MGDIVDLKQPKDKLYSTAVWMQQFKRIVKHWAGPDDAHKEKFSSLLDTLTEGIAGIIQILPDSMKLDCKLAEIDNVIYVKNEEEAEKVMKQWNGDIPKTGESIH